MNSRPQICWAWRIVGVVFLLAGVAGGSACRTRADVPSTKNIERSAAATTKSDRAVPVTSARAAWPFAVADFDGDSLPDFASVQVGESAPSFTQYWIHFRLSSGPRVSVRVTAPVGGLHIAPRDVNGDHFPDLIVTTALWHEPVTVLVNDGHGNFASREPAAFSAAIWGLDTIWFSVQLAPREICGAIPQRNFSAVCGSLEGGVSAFCSSRLLFPREFCDAPFRDPSSFFGRAPPRFLPL